MDNNIFETVYNSLVDSTEAIAKDVAEYAKTTKEVESGRFTQDAIQNEIFPKQNELRRKIRESSEKAIATANDIIKQYRIDVERMNELDPAEITDDINLLQDGIVLLPRDIRAMMRRNAENRTMTQIILRYAHEHDIDTSGIVYTGGGQREMENAKNLEEIVRYYAGWIDKPNAPEMLRKFFLK